MKCQIGAIYIERNKGIKHEHDTRHIGQKCAVFVFEHAEFKHKCNDKNKYDINAYISLPTVRIDERTEENAFIHKSKIEESAKRRNAFNNNIKEILFFI